MIRVLVVDDEAPARRKLRRLLAAAPGVEVVGEAADGEAAVKAVLDTRPDLVFLDVRMPGLDGFGVVEALTPERMPQVVFVTAYDEYAVRAFEVEALDYLMKPVAPSRFAAALERARGRLARGAVGRHPERLEALLGRVGRPRYLERLLVEEGGRWALVRVDAIDLVEAARNYVVLHAGGRTHVLRRPLSSLAERLDPQRFLQINRSEIVRMDALKEVRPWSHGDWKVLLADGRERMWSRRYRARRPPGFDLG